MTEDRFVFFKALWFQMIMTFVLNGTFRAQLGQWLQSS